ncbi:MAG TPA: thioredoxin domain-containing protein [Thermoanaerobaculia bacterium]
MKRTLIVLATLAVATFALAQEPAETKLDAQTEKIVRQSVPVCADMTITKAELQTKLPPRMTGSLIRLQSPHPGCTGQLLMAFAPSGDYYLGLPWIMGDEAQGATLAEKLKNFAWTRLQENFTAVVERERTRNGLFPVMMYEMTEHGKVPIEGEVDPEGKVFFLGHFHPATADAAAGRIKELEPLLANAPWRGAAKPAVTIVEFSDFECPSCKRASGYVDPIVEKYGDRVRYIRYDLPLVTTHPWAFAAALAGRAIYHQKPAVFWDYKKQIYANQDKLTAFAIDDFARGFAQDHELDMKQYDADLASQAIQDDLLKSVGLAFSTDVRATPTYMVNGIFVEPGDEGSALESYVASLLKK